MCARRICGGERGTMYSAPSPPPAAGMSLREATLADLDAMTWVLVAASPLDPVYPYRFPDRLSYPAEFAQLCRQKCREYLATSTVMVCEMEAWPSFPSASECGQKARRVVAFSAWDAPVAQSTPPHVAEPLSKPVHNPVSPVTIGNQDRMNAFRKACQENKASFFDARYPRGHMFLKILLCHPDYQRKGAGQALTTWGINRAKALGLNTTVFASPMGHRLYKKLGFQPIGSFRVQLVGDEDFLEIPALIFKPQDDGQHEVRPVKRAATRETMVLRVQSTFHHTREIQVRTDE
ncbi:hypothetical protein B0H63DRAFT_468443 [Podospora didyma]|uniref:N-acetyltransferase domain-containing protein n=1 Tax=Podospora didyma TaxID=330526 RepID=A0AAE0U0X2_9PEZI|nr:hypothetical protein B0H63DRAFT_468443 [Podospora didyma]